MSRGTIFEAYIVYLCTYIIMIIITIIIISSPNNMHMLSRISTFLGTAEDLNAGINIK
jgi:uncharacterized membrane protein